jgi:hypothetical protein
MDERDKQEQSPIPPAPSGLGVLEVFDFYWRKFLARNKVLENEEEQLEKKAESIEQEIKVKKIRNRINTIS